MTMGRLPSGSVSLRLAEKPPAGAGPLQVRAFSATDLQFLNTLIGDSSDPACELTNGAVAPYSGGTFAQERLGAVTDLVEREGFEEIGGASALEKLLGLGLEGTAGHEQDPTAQRRVRALQGRVESWPIQVRHPHVAHNEIVGVLLDRGQGLAPVRGRVDFMSAGRQDGGEDLHDPGLVIHDEDVFPADRFRRGARFHGGTVSRPQAHAVRHGPPSPPERRTPQAVRRGSWCGWYHRTERSGYEHREVSDLERLLEEARGAPTRLIVTDGVC